MKPVIKFFLISLIIAIQLTAQSWEMRYVKTDHVDCPAIYTTVQVFDKVSRDPVKNLKADDFTFALNANTISPKEIWTYADKGAGTRIVLCIDLSGSMKGQPLTDAKNAINNFIDSIRSMDQLQILSFANDVKIEIPFTNNKTDLHFAVDDLTVRGNRTSLYIALNDGLKALNRDTSRIAKMLMVIGDGKDEDPVRTYSINDIIESAKADGIPIFTIGYTRVDQGYLKNLEKLSENTGGNFYPSPNESDLSRQFQKVRNQILNIYVLKVDVSGKQGDAPRQTFSITLNHQNYKQVVVGEFTGCSGSGIPLWTYWAGGALLLLLIVLGILLLFRKQNKQLTAMAQGQERELRSIKTKIEEQAEREKATGKQDNEPKDPATIPSFQPPKAEQTLIFRPGVPSADDLKDAPRLLLRVVGGQLGGDFTITPHGATIGRNPANSICIADQYISGNHARIDYANGYYYITNLSTSNGTMINGNRIESPAILKHNDVITMGTTQFLVIFF